MTQISSAKASGTPEPTLHLAVETEPAGDKQEPGAHNAAGPPSATDEYAKAEARPSPSALSPLCGPQLAPATPPVEHKPPAMPATLTHPIPKGRPLNRADFQHAEVRAAVARALARRSAPFGLQPVTSNEPPIVIPDLLSRAQNVAAHQAASGRPPRLVIDGAQLQATVAFLSQGIQEASGGLKANVVFNGYPAAFSFTDNGALISNLDMGSEMAWHEWFAPMARLGYTARLSHEQLTEMAEVYKKALLEDESATLSEADRRGLALYEYALNLLYIFYHADLSYQKPDGTPAAEPEARAYLANAQVVLDRARQDQRRLRGLIPTLDLPHGGAMRLI